MIKELENFYKQIETESYQPIDSNLNSDYILSLPDSLKLLHNYQVFGSDQFAVPNDLIIKRDTQEYEKPFSFLALNEEIKIFESEYRSEIPDSFIPFGYLYGGTDIVLLDKTRDTVHVFHVSDIADTDWLKQKLKNETCSYFEFIKNIRRQTVTCLINPDNYSEAFLIEIRENDRLYCDYTLKPSSKYFWQDYISMCKSYIEKGFKIHYSSRRIKEMLCE